MKTKPISYQAISGARWNSVPAWPAASRRHGRLPTCAAAGGFVGNAGALVCAMLAIGLLASVAGCSKSGSNHAGHAAEAGAKAAKYYCPMHPTYTSDRPGDCPICGMKLVAIKDGQKPGAADEATVAGRVAVMVPPEKRQLIGLTTSTVEQREFRRTLRLAATVLHDETRLARIAPRFGGWVRTLHVNYTGQHVERGEPLFSVYSPELYAAENDYLLALRNQHLAAGHSPAEPDPAKSLLESARHRLELFQVGEEEIRALEERGRPGDELLLRAPVSGHVVSKTAVEGKAFMPGETLYEIADLAHLWLEAYVYETELPEIRVGQKARVVFPNLNNRAFESEVTFIYPHIDPQTRRGRIRLELDNPGHLLRPEMWANVELEVDLGRVLTVPASAVIDTGTRHVAFVDRDDGHLEPREVKTGAKGDDYIEVLDGLKAGERVVTRALFLVDSESQLQAAISGMTGGEDGKH